MSNYKPGSSNDPTKEKKKVEKVITGTAKVKKKNDNKFADIFISEDIHNVKSYVFMDVLVPAIKKAVFDIITDGIEMILYGEARGRGRSQGNGAYVSYNNYSNRKDYRRDEPRARVNYSYGEVSVDNRGDAERILDQMNGIMADYGMVSVADLYDLAGVTGNFTDHKYGWFDIRSAKVVRGRDGYIIQMPKAVPLD